MLNRNEQKIVTITADEVKQLIQKHNAAVKAFRSKIDEKQIEYKEWMFFINQYIDPENNRPIKDPEQKMLSTEFYDPSTGGVKSRLSRVRGLPKKGTVNIKKTPISLLPTNGRMQTFHMDKKFYTTGLIYNIELCSISPKWIFNGNMTTNDRWHIPGQPGYTDVVKESIKHRSTTLENIRNTQNELMKEKKRIHWNELNAKTNRDSIRGIFTIQPYQENVYITDRINAIHKKYIILTHLARDLPIFCISSAEEASEYTVLQQATDILNGLKRHNNKPTDTTYFGYIITKSLPFHLIFTPHSKLGTELVNIISKNEQYVKHTPQCAIFYYLMKNDLPQAMQFIPTEDGLFEAAKEWVNKYKDNLIKSTSEELFNTLCIKLNIFQLELTEETLEKVKTTILHPLYASELFYLAIKKDEIDVAKSILKHQIIELGTPHSLNKDTVFHLLAESKNRNNLEFLTELCKRNTIAHIKNKNGETPIEVAIEEKNLEAVLIFIKHHFNNCLNHSLLSSIPLLITHNELKLADEIITKKGKKITDIVDENNNNCLHLYPKYCHFDVSHLPLFKKILNNTKNLHNLLFTKNKENVYALTGLIEFLPYESIIEIIDRVSCLENPLSFTYLLEIFNDNDCIEPLIYLVSKYEAFDISAHDCWNVIIRNKKYLPDLVSLMAAHSNVIPSSVIYTLTSPKNMETSKEIIPLMLKYPDKISHEYLYLFAKYFIQTHQPESLSELIRSHDLFKPTDQKSINKHCPQPLNIFFTSITNQSSEIKHSPIKTYEKMFFTLNQTALLRDKSHIISKPVYDNFIKHLTQSKNIDLIQFFIKYLDFNKESSNENTLNAILAVLNNNLTEEAYELLDSLQDFNKDKSSSMIIFPLVSKIPQINHLFFLKFLEKIALLNYSFSKFDLPGIFLLNDEKITHSVKDKFKSLDIFIDGKIISLSQTCQISELEFIAWLIANFKSNIRYDESFLLKNALTYYTEHAEEKSTNTIIKYLVHETPIQLPYEFIKPMIEKKDHELLKYLTEENRINPPIYAEQSIIHKESKIFNNLVYYLNNHQLTLFMNLALYFLFTYSAEKQLILHLSKILNEDIYNKNPTLSEKLLSHIMWPLNNSIITEDIFESIKGNVCFIIFLLHKNPFLNIPPHKIKTFAYNLIDSEYKCLLPFILYNKKIHETDYEYLIEFIKIQINEHTSENNLTSLIKYLMLNSITFLKPDDQFFLLDLLIEKNINDEPLYSKLAYYFHERSAYQIKFLIKIANYKHADKLNLSYHNLESLTEMVDQLYSLKEDSRVKPIQLLLKNIHREDYKKQIIELFLEKTNQDKDAYLTALLLEHSLSLKKMPFLLLQSSILTCATDSKLAPKIVDFLSLIPKDEKGSNIKKMTSDLINASIKQINTSFAVMSIITKIDTSDECKFIKAPERNSTLKSHSWKNVPISNTWKTILELAKNRLLELVKQEPIGPEPLLKEILEFLKTPIKSPTLYIFSHSATAAADQLVAAFHQTLKEKSIKELAYEKRHTFNGGSP